MRIRCAGAVTRRSGRLRWMFGGQGGFSLVELLIAALVLVVGLIAIGTFMSATVGAVLNSDVRTLMQQAASTEIENIRGLPYGDIGTTTGNPPGVLLASENKTVKGVNVHITREVTFITDSSYAAGGPYPANYRRVTVRVSQVGNIKLKAVEMMTNIAGGAAGGSLDITVTKTDATPVPDALLVVKNTNLDPDVSIDDPAIRTDAQGHLLIPGLRPDPTNSYSVVASKSGYNSDAKIGLVVNDGLPYTVVQLYCQPLSNLLIRMYDSLGQPAPYIQLRIAGPEVAFLPLTGWLDPNPQVITTGEDGTVFLSNIRYSTDVDDYRIEMISPGYPPVDATTCVLNPGITHTIDWTLPALTTTTTAAPTTTTTLAPTTTTTGVANLTVRVRRAPNTNTNIPTATVVFRGQTGLTNSSGRVTFNNVPTGPGGLRVEKAGYAPWEGTITIPEGGLTYIVYMVRL